MDKDIEGQETNTKDSKMEQKNKGYWIICANSYEYDGVEIPKGRMKYHTSSRPVISSNWRRATDIEINDRKYFKGNAFYISTPNNNPGI